MKKQKIKRRIGKAGNHFSKMKGVVFSLCCFIFILIGSGSDQVSLQQYTPGQAVITVFAGTAGITMAQINYVLQDGETAVNSSYTVPYNESVFDTTSFQYQNDLAMISLGVAVSAGNAAVSDLFDNFVFDSADNLRSANCKETLNSLGFTSLSFYHYEIPTTDASDKVAFALGSKVISEDGKEVLLVVAALRGIGYGSEWASNFNVGTGTEHQGFLAAANDVKLALDAYVDQQKTSTGAEDVKIWITGYSRAGAVANLAAARLDEDSSYSKENIYAYTFSAPNTVRDSGTAKDDYGNIFNLKNAEDLVTTLPFPAWGYTCYGNDCTFPLLLEGYDSGLWVNTVIASGTGLAAVGTMDDLLLKLYPTVDVYAAGLQQQLMDQIAQGSTESESIFDVMNQSMESTGMGAVSDQLFSGMDSAMVAAAHGPDCYMAWFAAGTNEETFSLASYHRFLIDTTADLTIYGADNTILFQSIDGTAVTSLLPSSVSFGRFAVYLYGDTDFTFEITGDGTAGFHIEEYKALQACSRVVAFDLLELSDIPWKGTCRYDMAEPQDYALFQEGSADYLPEHDSGEIKPSQYLAYASFEDSTVSDMNNGSKTDSTSTAVIAGDDLLQNSAASGSNSQSGTGMADTTGNDSMAADEAQNEEAQASPGAALTQTPDGQFAGSTVEDENSTAGDENSSGQESGDNSKRGLLYGILGSAVMLMAAGFLQIWIRKRKGKNSDYER